MNKKQCLFLDSNLVWVHSHSKRCDLCCADEKNGPKISWLFCAINPCLLLPVKILKELSIDGKQASGMHIIIRYKALCWFYFTFWHQTIFCETFYDAYFQNFKMKKPFVWTYKQGVSILILRLPEQRPQIDDFVARTRPYAIVAWSLPNSLILSQFFTKAIGFLNLNCHSNQHPTLRSWIPTCVVCHCL